MKITVNDKQYDLNRTEMTCSELLSNIKIDTTGLIVELDGKIYTAQQFNDAVVKDGSKLELIRIMGGG